MQLHARVKPAPAGRTALVLEVLRARDCQPLRAAFKVAPAAPSLVIALPPAAHSEHVRWPVRGSQLRLNPHPAPAQHWEERPILKATRRMRYGPACRTIGRARPMVRMVLSRTGVTRRASAAVRARAAAVTSAG